MLSFMKILASIGTLEKLGLPTLPAPAGALN